MQKKLFCVVTFFFVHLCSAVLADTNPFKEKSCGQMFGAEEITKWDKCVGEVEQNDIKWLGLYSKGSLNGLGVIWFDGGKTKFFGHFFDGLPQRGYAVDENSKIALVENYELCEECSFGNVDEIFPYIDAKFWALSTTERTLLQRNLDATGYFPLEIDGDLNKVFEAFAGYAIIEKNIISLEDEYYVDLIFSELLNQPLPSKADYDGGKSPLYNAEDDLTLLLGGEVSVSKIGAWELLKSTNSCAVESMPLFSRQSFRSNNEKDFLGNPLITVHDQALGSKLRISSNSSEDGGDITVDVNKQKNELTTFFNKDTNYKVKDWKIGTLDKNYKENYFSNFKWRETKTSFNLTDYNTDEVSGLFSNNVLIVSSSYIDENSNLLEVRDYYDATSLDEAMAVLHTDHCPNSLDFQTLVWTEFWGTAILIASGKKRESVSLAEHCQENSTAFCVSDQDYVVVAEAANCSTDPSKCSMIQLCAKASGTSAAGEKFWRMDAEFQSYVGMAKIIGVTCGVGPNQVQMVQIDNCDTNPSKCSMIDLCAKASGTTSSGEKFWRLDAELQEYVHAAKTIGVSCGVQKSATANAQSVTVSKPKMVQKYTNRKALVIGNANYLDQTPLKNPINDAKAVAAKLEQVGFEVTYKEDLGVREFGRTLSAYERSLSGSDMSLFYYAGHGIEIDKQNYLIPVDAEITAPEDARYETVVLDDAISASLNTGKLSMILIDACRDNPFSGKMSGGTRSVGRGLSIVDVGKGNVNQIISFAASSGEVAEDGSGQNSPYASAIIDLLDEPNLEIGKLFRLVRDRVTQATGGKQKPVVNQDLSGEDIFLVVE